MYKKYSIIWCLVVTLIKTRTSPHYVQLLFQKKVFTNVIHPEDLNHPRVTPDKLISTIFWIGGMNVIYLVFSSIHCLIYSL